MSPRYLVCQVIAALILHFAGYAQCLAQAGDIDPEKVAAARSFLAVSRAAEELSDDFRRYQPRSNDYMVQFADRLRGTAARQKFREIFDRIWPEIQDKAMARSGELIDRYALAYARRFSVDELNAWTAFYRSPTGRKLLSSTDTLADVLNGANSAPEPERVRTARALVEILKQTDPFTAALGLPAQAHPSDDLGSSADNTPGRMHPSPADAAAARLEKLAVFFARSFTVDELEILKAFYRSPFAQKMGRVAPELQADLANLTAAWFEPFRLELETRLADATVAIANE